MCTKGDRVKKGGQFDPAFRRYRKEFLDGVDGLSENDFTYAQGSVAFAEFFCQKNLLLHSVVIVVWSEEIIKGTEEIPHNLLSFWQTSLNYANEVIKVDFNVQ